MPAKVCIALGVLLAIPLADESSALHPHLPHRSSSVQIKADHGVVLAGELRLPGASTSRRPPVVLLLGGGGPSPHGIYPDLEARLLDAGIATLSYDKRGVGRSTGTYLDTMDLMQRDAGTAVEYLRARGDVDGRRIAVLGLSQGGVLGSALASKDRAIRAVVMLAAPAGERAAMFLDEMRIKLASAGMRNDAIDQVMAATRSYMDVLTTGSSSVTITAAREELGRAFVAAGWNQAQSEGAVRTLSDPATVSLYKVAANEALAQVEVPVLALYAANDTVISTSRSVREARQALRNNKDAAVIEVPNVNHGFQQLETRVSGEASYKGWPVSDPGTIDLIHGWLVKHLLDPKRN